MRLSGDDDPETHMMLRHLPEMIQHFLERVVLEAPASRRSLRKKDEPDDSP
jgi:hypothetical protein